MVESGLDAAVYKDFENMMKQRRNKDQRCLRGGIVIARREFD